MSKQTISILARFVGLALVICLIGQVLIGVATGNSEAVIDNLHTIGVAALACLATAFQRED